MAVQPTPVEVVIDGERTPVPMGAVAFKYEDAVEEACWLYDQREAEEIARQDPTAVVWVEPR
jgi:hypothetical protein